ncbi:universal stress protein, partial [Paraburkholderia strydomiana]
MNCKTLLVHLDDSAHSAARLAYAMEVAAHHDAHLIGLYAVSEEPVDPLFVHGENVWSPRREAQRNANETTAHTHFVAGTERA